MAERSLTQAVGHSGDEEILPTRAILDARLEAQRERIFQIMGICGLGAAAGYSADVGGRSKGLPENIWCALDLARKLLNDIAGELDPMRMLDPEISAEEMQHG